jgi:hypothetical protein
VNQSENLSLISFEIVLKLNGLHNYPFYNYFCYYIIIIIIEKKKNPKNNKQFTVFLFQVFFQQ